MRPDPATGPMSGDGVAPGPEDERLLRTVLDDAPLGFAVFDDALHYVYVNNYHAALHDMAASQLVGRPISGVHTTDLVRAVQDRVRHVLRTGEVDHDVELDLSTPDEDLHLLVNRFPLRGRTGSVVGVAVTVQDVTQLRKLAALETEGAYRHAQVDLVHRLEQAQRIGGLGSWEIDLATGRVRWSRQMCAIAGVDHTPDAEAAFAMVHPDDQEIARQYHEALSAGCPAGAEIRMIRPDGVTISVISAGEPVLDDTGAVVRVQGTALDKTAQRAAEDAARCARAEAEAARAGRRVDRDALVRLQHALLPASIPEIPGVSMSVAYEPADCLAGIGGDFYDCFALGDGLFGFVIGDVAGHDVEAATTMGQIRAGVHAYALEDGSPGSVLRRLNRLVLADANLAMTTMMFGTYRQGDRLLTYSNAGHPKPVLCRNGRAQPLDHPHGPALGAVTRDCAYPEATLNLLPGDVMLWYTDGLVERRNTDVDAMVRHLCELLTADVAVEKLPSYLVAHIVREEQDDDICVFTISANAITPPA
ncbi:SpoIIE family protein phosphatase [Lentzea sp. PSKA42]|uniref:SpoIIE family protein phosphatase n=1 Tax=Lentzea indica TaxID=2604800 RepID=A0ABX1FHC5_9PSEU|nr:SpoIIE family protein phosphatase [Lentzea indica]NKE58379.1 SpoIIE family protein phosphatase [Lentzea indica]